MINQKTYNFWELNVDKFKEQEEKKQQQAMLLEQQKQLQQNQMNAIQQQFLQIQK